MSANVWFRTTKYVKLIYEITSKDIKDHRTSMGSSLNILYPWEPRELYWV